MARPEIIKKAGASESILTVLIWAVFSLLLVRVYLQLTGYPQIGRGTWHISHVLFGGVIMAVGSMMSMTLEGKKIGRVAEAIFGFGLGWFIDEVGKFMTKDYNYFFRPAIIIMYISFVGLFLLYRYLESIQAKSDAARFYGVLNKLEEVIDNDLEIKEKLYLVNNLRQIATTSKRINLKILAKGILETINKIKPITDRKFSNLERLVRKFFRISYNKIFKRKLVMYGLWAYSVYYAIDKVFDILRISTSRQKMLMIERFYQDYDFFGKSDLYMIVFKMIFDLAAAVLFLMGARYFWSKKRISGIKYFRYGLYVSIFFVSIFRFYFEQFGAIYELAVSIILLGLLNQYLKELVAKK